VIFLETNGTVFAICTATAFVINPSNSVTGFSNALQVGINLSATAKINGSITGNAATADQLSTARLINGVPFNATSNITVTANTPNLLKKGTYISGSDFNGNTETTWSVDATSSNNIGKVVARNSEGGFSAGTITATFVGDLTGNVTASTGISTFNTVQATQFIGATLSGNAASATRLATARTINGVAFDGSNSITVPASADTLTGTTINGTVTLSSLTQVGTLSSLNVNDSGIFVGSGNQLRMFVDSSTPTIRSATGRLNFDMGASGPDVNFVDSATSLSLGGPNAPAITGDNTTNLGITGYKFNGVYANNFFGNATTATLATTATNLPGGGLGAIPYQTAANTTAMLGLGTAGTVLTAQAGGLAWQTIAQESLTKGNYISLSGTLTSTIVDATGYAIPSAAWQILVNDNDFSGWITIDTPTGIPGWTQYVIVRQNGNQVASSSDVGATSIIVDSTTYTRSTLQYQGAPDFEFFTAIYLQRLLGNVYNTSDSDFLNKFLNGTLTAWVEITPAWNEGGPLQGKRTAVYENGSILVSSTTTFGLYETIKDVPANITYQKDGFVLPDRYTTYTIGSTTYQLRGWRINKIQGDPFQVSVYRYSISGPNAYNYYDGSTALTLGIDAASSNTASKIVARDASGNFAAGTITANLVGAVTGNASTATQLQTARTINGVSFNGTQDITIIATDATKVALAGSTMTGYLTLVGAPVNANHATTKTYVDSRLPQYTIVSGAQYSTSGYTNQVGSFNDGANFFDVFPPAGKSMANIVAFIPSIHVVHYAGGVDGNDSIRCTYSYLGDRIRVYVQNTEQRSTPAANYLAIWS
jgi:hypothetical protein